jgi:hypothetical protein
MHLGYTFLALDLARQRSRDAERLRLARRRREDGRLDPGGVRRVLAAGLVLVARGSAAAATRLDDCQADDLRRILAPR